jgi:hypothetical protein
VEVCADISILAIVDGCLAFVVCDAHERTRTAQVLDCECVGVKVEVCVGVGERVGEQGRAWALEWRVCEGGGPSGKDACVVRALV